MEEKIYPLYFKNRFWNEEDVDDIFRCFYFTKMALDGRMSVYVAEGLRRTIDGEWIE